MARPDVKLRIDDLPLFKKARSKFRGERMSQYERAEQIRDAFAHCMNNTLGGVYCSMPSSCAHGESHLYCNHLDVDYSNFSGHGIPLTGRAQKMIDARLRAIGTLVYRYQLGMTGPFGPLPGDIHIPSLARISSFQGTRKGGAVAARATRKAGAVAQRATTRQSGGLFGWLFGS